MSILLLGILLVLSWLPFAPPVMADGCQVVQSTPGTYVNGQYIKQDLCDTNGNKKVTLGGAGGGSIAIDQTTPGTTNGVSLTTLLSGEDQTNNLLMTSGGAVRITQLVGTGGVPSTASDATGTVTILPVGKKTFHALETCTGTCTQIIKIYGAQESSGTIAKSILACTITLNASTTATDYCVVDMPFSYWFPVTSGTGGTTPLSAVMVMY